MAYKNNKAISGDVSIGGRYFANYGSAGIKSPAIHASQIDEFNEGIALEIETNNSRAAKAVKTLITSTSAKMVAGVGITIGTESDISVNYDTNTLGTAVASDSSSTQKLKVNLNSNGGLVSDSNGIKVNLGSGLAVLSGSSGNNRLSINVGDGLTFDGSGGTVSVTNAGAIADGSSVILGTFKTHNSQIGVPFDNTYFSESSGNGISLNISNVGSHLGTISAATIKALA